MPQRARAASISVGLRHQPPFVMTPASVRTGSSAGTLVAAVAAGANSTSPGAPTRAASAWARKPPSEWPADDRRRRQLRDLGGEEGQIILD